VLSIAPIIHPVRLLDQLSSKPIIPTISSVPQQHCNFSSDLIISHPYPLFPKRA